MPTHRAPKPHARPSVSRIRDGAPRWILLLPQVPGESSNARVRVWRRLQSIGALMLRNAVWVLPGRDECVEAFQWVAREIEAQGGQASLCEGQFFDAAADDDLERRFTEARNVEYHAIAERARALLRTLGAKKLSPERRRALAGDVDRIARRLREVIAVDWCSASGRETAEGLVAQVQTRAVTSTPGTADAAPLARIPCPRGATWVTRTGVHIDRIASAWLIRRFIDPKAKLKFVPAKGYVPVKGELRFDMFLPNASPRDDAELTHVGDRCTFEVLLERFGVGDHGLRAIADIVHDLDLEDGKYGREETAGVRTLVVGICTAHRDDEARIALGSSVLDALHATFLTQSASRSSRKGGASS